MPVKDEIKFRIHLAYFAILVKESIKRYLNPIINAIIFVKLRQGSGKDRQGMAVKAKGLKA